ncbi:DUF1254 domain-containing protein [Pseudoteredinibacter isoporae]|uniref:DUF1254 domain-containing protein n=1 Tax=Pseudoteredinibacter isoporae TaxID=570281 RepID=A0A7X0MY89_9GAMM|nr:DUF1254 domain-containing protein [Pseudoteredinibacter isoporae]MBB6521762.1 hypothetical protein [Pseudoteredinibacter isoporae]NHO87309.1 DUF1254 domain-containing protein [Pseudoteredinibacter isoporae]NIB23059.1 DUF1254 domain-containing protein [Pseudoteredinibacter isoporae]
MQSSFFSLTATLSLTSSLLVTASFSSIAEESPVLMNHQNIKQQDEAAKENWAYSTGIQAYVFGLPMTIFDREYRIRTNPKLLARVRHLCPCAPPNQLGHMNKLATDKDNLPYTPNNDTVYSGAVFDVSEEPVILSLPDETERYWSLQLTDQNLENFAYLGSRASEGKGGHFLFAGPDWRGKAPEDTTVIRTRENIFLGAIRIAVDQDIEGDLEKVQAMQAQMHTTSLSNWGKAFGKVNPVALKRPNKKYQGELPYFTKMADLMMHSPPEPKHAAALAQFKTIGLVAGQAFEPEKLDTATLRGLQRAELDAYNIMRWKVKYRGTAYDTGWNNLHEGSYGYNYINRAEGALEGLIVHDREEAVYFSTYEDGQGDLLDAGAEYVLHFEADEIPKVVGNGFWSLTMYGPDFQLVENPINRYAITDRSKGLHYNDDGSLTIYIQRKPPEGNESNWLPTPSSGLFRINYRIYRPSEEASNPKTLHKYIPGIKKAG